MEPRRAALTTACASFIAEDVSLRVPVRDTNCTAITTEKACDSNTDCTWCQCRAVPSACYTVEQAKK